MLGGAVGAGSPTGDDLLTVTVARDEHGYGMKVSGDNPVYVQSVKEHGAAWRAGLRAGDRILRVDSIPVHHHTHQQVVHMIRANPTTVLTVQQNSSRHKTPITAPVPVNPEKQRQLEVSKVHTVRLMLEQEQKYIRDLKNSLLKVPDVRKQALLESAEQRCSILQHEIDTIMAGQTDNRNSVPVMHVRSQSSPEHLDHELPKGGGGAEKEAWSRGTSPPGTPPPPYPHSTQPCTDPQRAIISMEEDDSPASDSSTYSGLFSNLRTVRDSKARMAVLINWLLGERRCACAALVLVLTDAYRAAAGAPAALRRWAYEIHSVFLMPNAVLQLNGVDENMANEIEHVLVNEYEKEELLRNVFRKARRQAKDELAKQLSEFQGKRRLGLATLYGPDDATLQRCDVDKAQEVVVVERIMCQRLRAVAQAGPGCPCAAGPGGNAGSGGNGGNGGSGGSPEAHSALLAALVAAALCLHCRPASVAAAVGGARAAFLQRDKLYKQRVKQLAKQHPQPYVVRGHHLQLQAITSLAHCHHCELPLAGLAPQAYVCTDCKLRVHRGCARAVEEGCCLDGEHAHTRISRFMERIHPTAPGQDSADKKSRKSSGTANFLNMERSFRKMEDEPNWDQTLTPIPNQGESRREGSTEEQSAPDVDNDASENNAKEVTEKENKSASSSWRSGGAGAGAASRGVYRAESCRERDAPRRGKHRNASDPNRLTAHPSHDLEPGAATAPSGSSSSSSLSSRSNESNTVAAEQQDWSEEEEPLAAQWADSLPPAVRDSVLLCARLRKRQEVIHELIVSEGSHVRWLKVLGGDFLRPLERQPALLPAEELRALFPNLPAVRERHARLYAELRAARAAAPRLLVPVRAVADVLLSTLGEPGYAGCLARFCRGQRMALEALRERRRKNKELHQFLAGREQLPRCGRLQLRDLLACVWQRLTKYQLLLESILKTVVEEEVTPEAAAAGAAAAGADGESAEDIAQLRRALATAKEVLHTVDTAIRTAENEHRLKTIQSKLEVRAPVGGEWEELRRLDLTAHALRMEGELLLRTDAKKCGVRALMLEDSLVLLQREADRFLLKPIAQPSQNTLLSPLIKWDKVLFRPNAAMRNTFFLMNINGIQMHELSANTAAEYATWVRLIQESPLARLAETKSAAHQHTRSADDSGINVSRNPSDASEKSTSSAPPDDAGDSDREKLDKLDKLDKMDKSDKEAEKESQERSSLEREKASMEGEEVKGERERSASEDKDDSEDKHRRATVGRITTHIPEPDGEALEESDALVIRPPLRDVPTAQRVLSHSERLRRLDAAIARALSAKSAVVGELLGLPPRAFAHLAELAVADTLGHDDLSGDLRPNEMSVESEPDIHQLLLAAQAQANQLTEMLSSALSISEATAMRVRSGRCDSCRARDARFNSSEAPDTSMSMDEIADGEFPRENNKLNQSQSQPQSQSLDASFDMLPDASQEIQEPDIDSYLAADGAGAAALAARLAGVSGGLQAALGRLVAALPALHAQRAALRHELALSREREQRARADKRMTEEMSILKDGVDQSIQDQPSNGG
ncbi:rho guanine nucleotide exchange factor 11 isoform X2 [Zerene cesonia]|uniref:rho guanine nucleotide exchange factor 11 isoform X2 n=1 Tax=Zerene cesonia TaxID=33412 RepID=UPI0018E4EB93|nr:rho guanine nucleotide exchange factor 11 isoform X2 [Zerene cesonia]